MIFWNLIITSLIAISIITIANISSRNVIVLLLAIELLFFSISLACIVYFFNNKGSHWNYDILFAAIALTVLAAAESAVGLAIMARVHKRTRSIRIKKL